MTDAISIDARSEAPRTALVRRAREGDHEAFDELMSPVLDRHLRFAISLIGIEADARDVVQETCLRAWKELPSLRDPSRFDSWLSQILVNAARSHLRTRRRAWVRELSIDALERSGREPTATRPTLDDHPEADAIRRAFASLDVNRRTLLILHHVDGRSIAEIARVLRIAEGTAKWRLYAARRALERALKMEGKTR